MFARLIERILSIFSSSRAKKTAGVGTVAVILATATPMVMVHEGLRTKAYLDPVGIPTICFGETLGVKMGDVKSEQECTDMLQPRLEGFLTHMRSCTRSETPIPAKTEAAFLSFTYNLGTGVYCRNIAGKRINVGDLEGACAALLLYTKAGGRELRGLVTRRKEEHALCVEGLREAGL
jgi:lysozyme